MTYSGWLSLIYAQVDRDDHRVRSAVQWARNNWSLEENPGLGDSGLFFFYNVVSRAMDTYGTDSLTLATGDTVNWRQDLLAELVARQKAVEDAPGQGYWVNAGSSRFWEGDAVLVTSYAIHALLSAMVDGASTTGAR